MKNKFLILALSILAIGFVTIKVAADELDGGTSRMIQSESMQSEGLIKTQWYTYPPTCQLAMPCAHGGFASCFAFGPGCWANYVWNGVQCTGYNAAGFWGSWAFTCF